MNKILISKYFLSHFSLLVVALLLVSNVAAASPIPVGSDDRIKTMVFSAEEVYTVLTKVGFSTAIDLSEKEKVQTISLGSSVGWQITPAKNKIFVKPLLRNGTTNLSIATDKRTYQFELIVSSSPVKNTSHAYVVKFFYPEEKGTVVVPEDRTRGNSRPISTTPIPEIPMVQPISSPPTPIVSPQSSATYPSGSDKISGLPSLGTIGIQAYNFNYTLTGAEDKSPKKIFDDGSATYFEYDFPLTSVPQIYTVDAAGLETPVNVRTDGNKYVVNSVAPRFVIRDGNASVSSDRICVFNEALLSSSAQVAMKDGVITSGL